MDRETASRAHAVALADLLRQVTAASLDPRAVLEIVTRWLAWTLGDAASVRPLSADGHMLEPGAVAHRDPQAEELAAATAERRRPVDADTPTAEVLRSAVPFHLPTVTEAPPGALRDVYVERVGVSSLILAPLRSRGETIGLLALTRDRGGAPYTDDDVALVTEVAERVGLVYDNARLYDRVRLQAVTLEHVDAPVVRVDARGRVVTWNLAAERMFGWSEEEALGTTPSELVSAEDEEKVASAAEVALRHGHWAGEWRLRRRDGSVFEGHVDTVVLRDDAGRLIGMVATYQDLSERLALIRALERHAAQQSALAELGERALEADRPAVLLDHAVAAVRRTLNVDLCAVLTLVDDGRQLELAAGAGFADGLVGHDRMPATWTDSQAGFTLMAREPIIVDDVRTERRFAQAPRMAEYGARSAVTVVVQGRGGAHGVLGAYRTAPSAFTHEDADFLRVLAHVLGDALDAHATAEEVRRRGLHDPLTELPNRVLVLDRLTLALNRADRAEGRVALMFLDLDDFKLVNDRHGHRAGDMVLRRIARRLETAVRPGDTVGRFGGDEFVVLCEQVADQQEARTIAERLVAEVERPIEVEGRSHRLGMSVGIALGERGTAPDGLLRDADAAMYRAKESGSSLIEVSDLGAATD